MTLCFSCFQITLFYRLTISKWQKDVLYSGTNTAADETGPFSVIS